MEEAQAKAPPEMKAVADFLRNKSGMKVRTGALSGKRADYFKGRSAIKVLLSPAYAKLKTVPKVKDEAAAIALLHQLIPHTFYLRVERGQSVSGQSGGPRLIQIVPQQLFAPDEYYVWLMDANPIRQLLLAAAMVAVVLGAVMFPLWPAKLRVGVWYLSVGLLGLIGVFIALAVVRLIFWIITIVVAKPGIWIFPNLFADVGFVDSFIPLWSWDLPPPKKQKSEKKKAKRDAREKAGRENDHGHSHDGPDGGHGGGGGHSHGGVPCGGHGQGPEVELQFEDRPRIEEIVED
ncbi:BZ3500_MvSof-1268-A1-R1_Chr3-1g05522 [Microbotryum saponariae]|uniref:Translocation protein SEC62 n=1 Tax=Microbotryum saponariae TaxID=289078 RepID=A0A2X0LZ12_9BASI|nr:BZ3500_MvSof-1268-A1-R1_Chr3-1g05522 [Microbotryum saponariae]SDA04713.1 BZ3501_MvSof-1269-A2-R1_Chr3-1g05193 [Microbotryum saponariae]